MAAQTHHIQQQQQQLAQAVQALFQGSDNTLRRSADEWIRNFQTIPEAWTVAQAALHDPHAGPEVHFIAAQTLNCKMRYDFADQLENPTSRIALRDSLFKLIVAHSSNTANPGSTSGPVVTQLALALAALALQMREWESVFADVAQQLDSPQTLPVLLEVFQVIPEELGTGALDLDPVREELLHHQITEASSHVLTYMVRCAGQCQQTGGDNSDLLLARVYRCLAAWIEFGRIPPADLASCPLLLSAFESIASQQASATRQNVFTSAVALLIEAFHKYTGENETDDMIVIQALVPKVFALRNKFLECCQQAQTLASTSTTLTSITGDDLDPDGVAYGIARVFGHMGEAYVPLLVGEKEMDQPEVLKLMLLGAQHPDFAVAQKTFHFWDSLLIGISQIYSAELKHARITQLQPCLQELLVILLNRVRFPVTFDEQSIEVKEDFHDHRGFANDLFVGLSSVLTHEQVLGVLQQALAQGVEALAADPTRRWADAEAALFALRAISREFIALNVRPTPEVRNIVGQVLGFAMRIQSNDSNHRARLRGVAIVVVGNLGEWLDLSSSPADLGQIVNYVIGGFADVDTRVDAAYALKGLCGMYSTVIAQHFAGVVINVVHVEGVWKSLSSRQLSTLVEGLSYVISELPYDQAVEAVRTVTSNAVDCLMGLIPMSAAAAAQAGSPLTTKPNPEMATAATNSLAIIATLARFTKVQGVGAGKPHPSIELVRHLQQSGALSALVAVLGGENELCIEKLSSIYKQTMRASPAMFAPLLPDALALVLKGYGEHAQSPFMYVGCIAMECYGHDADATVLLIDMLTQFVTITFSRCGPNNPDALMEHPDIVEDMCLLVDRSVEKLPNEVTKSAWFLPVCQYACAGLMFDHVKANTASLRLLESILGLSDERYGMVAVVDAILANCGRELMVGLIGGLAGKLQQVNLVDRNGSIPGVLFELLRHLSMPTAAAGGGDRSVLDQKESALFELAFADGSCSHVNSELKSFFMKNVKATFNSGRDSEFTRFLMEFSQRARRRQKRVVAGASAITAIGAVA